MNAFTKADVRACYQYEEALRDVFKSANFSIADTEEDAEISIIAEQLNAKYAQWVTKNSKGKAIGSYVVVTKSEFDVKFLDRAGIILDSIRVKGSYVGIPNNINTKAVQKVKKFSERIFILRNLSPNDNPESQLRI